MILISLSHSMNTLCLVGVIHAALLHDDKRSKDQLYPIKEISILYMKLFHVE